MAFKEGVYKPADGFRDLVAPAGLSEVTSDAESYATTTTEFSLVVFIYLPMILLFPVVERKMVFPAF